MTAWTRGRLAACIDHTLLKPDATDDQIRALCAEAAKAGFASACVNPCHVPLVVACLAGSPVQTCAVVGFPLGASASRIKAAEAALAVAQGAAEVDMVLNVGFLKSGRAADVESDIRAVVAAAAGAVVKVILETCFLSDAEKRTACGLAVAAGAHFVKTSTGFGSGGATAADVRLLREAVGPDIGVKASGGIRTLADALAMLDAGASRIGTSAGVEIIAGLPQDVPVSS